MAIANCQTHTSSIMCHRWDIIALCVARRKKRRKYFIVLRRTRKIHIEIVRVIESIVIAFKWQPDNWICGCSFLVDFDKKSFRWKKQKEKNKVHEIPHKRSEWGIPHYFLNVLFLFSLLVLCFMEQEIVGSSSIVADWCALVHLNHAN